jgi:hypothetical protein
MRTTAHRSTITVMPTRRHRGHSAPRTARASGAANQRRHVAHVGELGRGAQASLTRFTFRPLARPTWTLAPAY